MSLVLTRSMMYVVENGKSKTSFLNRSSYLTEDQSKGEKSKQQATAVRIVPIRCKYPRVNGSAVKDGKTQAP